MRAPAQALALATACCFATGCLPRGPAPAGRRLLADGTAYDVLFVPGPAGSPSRLATVKITSDDGSGPLSLYAVQETAGDDELGTEIFLTDHLPVQDIACAGTSCVRAIDSQGRMFVQRFRSSTPAGQGYGLFDQSVARLDLTNGQVMDFGSMSALVGTFASGTSFAYTIQGSLRVRDTDDRETRFEKVTKAVVVNDALYFLTQDGAMGQGTVRRLSGPPFDAPQPVADQVTAFSTSPPAPLLVLCRSRPDDSICATSVLDLVTGQETPAPIDSGVSSISPSGRYLFTVRYDPNPSDINDTAATLSLFDRTLGSERLTTLTELNQSFWRPGHDEIWFLGTALGADQTLIAPEDRRQTFWRWGADADPSPVLPDQTIYIAAATDNVNGPFTPDGRFLITTPAPPQSDPPAVTLRDAESPAAPVLTLNPAGTILADVRQLPDGRLVVADAISDLSRADIYLADPTTGTMQAIAHGGHLVAIGATRVLALLDWEAGGASGSLSLIDLATGAITRLAQQVHAVAIDAPVAAGADPLAPGTRVAYVSQNRVSSPYDGLWLTSLP